MIFYKYIEHKCNILFSQINLSNYMYWVHHKATNFNGQYKFLNFKTFILDFKTFFIKSIQRYWQ